MRRPLFLPVAGLVAALCFFQSTAAAQRRQVKRQPAVKPVEKRPAKKITDAFHPAHVHIQKGRYAEALEALHELEKQKADAARLALFRSRCYREQGKWKEAEEILQTAIKTFPRKAELHAAAGWIQFKTGRYEDAEKTAEQAIKYDGQQPLAHLVLAEVYTETGRIAKALDGYRWFIRYYNRVQPKDAERLLLVARGSLQFARWKNSSQILRFVLNTLGPDALKDDEHCWQAYVVSGDLLLEKYNREDAMPEYQRALAINPNAADVLVSLGEASRQQLDQNKAAEYAEKALKAVPNHVEALQLKADVLISKGKIGEAVKTLKLALAVNPREQRTLARLAACYLLVEGEPPAKQLAELLANIDAIKQFQVENPSLFVKTVVDVATRNPKPGYFLTVLAESIEDRRQYYTAERFFKAAIRVMPELAQPKNSLGILYMRIGKTAEAKKLLDDAFKADPFHLRVFNMRKVLKLLDGYETIATPHFVIRFDSKADKVLAQYMAEYLEEIYPDLVKQYGFEPPQRTQFEIYHHGMGQKGHEWFSARMVGLPWLHTIGASTGVIVALTSPTATAKPFNWARVLKHEFVHIITLQQTKFNIPHWFTEALAVTAEGYPRSEMWDKLLLERVPKGELRTLANLNDGFIRAKNSADWQFAYCQSKLYAQYMVEKYGKDSIPKLLAAYRKNLPTSRGIQEACGVDIATFEKGYVEFLQNVVKGIQTGQATTVVPLDDAKKAYEADPTDTKAAGDYAFALFKAGQRRDAKAVAEKAVEKNAKEPLVAWVLASLALLAEDSKKATGLLEAALDRKSPHLHILLLLAKLKAAAEKNGDAADLLELGRKHYPKNEDVLIALGGMYVKLGENAKLKPLLEEVALSDYDDPTVRRKLMEISLAQKNYKDVVKYGVQALQIDVLDVATHRLLAEAYRELKDYKKSVREYEVALQLKPADAALQTGLAKTHIAAGAKEKAKSLLDAVLKADPQNAEAKSLRRGL
jgi:tetratricopeptide (TPR) repeat protein